MYRKCIKDASSTRKRCPLCKEYFGKYGIFPSYQLDSFSERIKTVKRITKLIIKNKEILINQLNIKSTERKAKSSLLKENINSSNDLPSLSVFEDDKKQLFERSTRIRTSFINNKMRDSLYTNIISNDNNNLVMSQSNNLVMSDVEPTTTYTTPRTPPNKRPSRINSLRTNVVKIR